MLADEELRNRLLARRRAIVDRLERARGTRVITLIHRREPWSDPSDQHITIEDTEFVLMEIRRTPPNVPIDVIIHTPGGMALAAEMIAMAVYLHPSPVTAIVPFYAMSGGTLIALAADHLIMEPFAVLGPVDPQVGGLPAPSLLRLLQNKPIGAIADQTLILADIARMASQNMAGFVKRLLGGRLSQERAERLADFLVGGYMTHDTPIMPDVLREYGVNVEIGVPSEVFELFETCSFGLCKRPCLAPYEAVPVLTTRHQGLDAAVIG